MTYINLDGKIIIANEACISPDNHAFRYGYGLFETILVQEGVPQLWQWHWERLARSMQKLAMPLPKLFTETYLSNELSQTVVKNNMADICRARIQVYAGNGGLYDTGNNQVHFLIECFGIEEHVLELNEKGLVMGIAESLNKSIDSLANLKSCNALVYIMAAKMARESKWNDALIRNTEGKIIESTIANLFCIRDSIVYTPPLTDGCIDGVMRRYVLSRAAEENIEIVEKSIDDDFLMVADEVFLTNAIRRIKWIEQINGQTYKNTVTKQIYKTLFGKG